MASGAVGDVTYLQTVHIAARVGPDDFTMVASKDATDCCIGKPGFQEAIELVLTSRGLMLRSLIKPPQYLTARALWSTKVEEGAVWSLARPPSPLSNAASFEVLGSGLFLAYDAGSRKFRMTKGLHPESVLSLRTVSDEQREAWSMARVIRRGTMTGPTAKEARDMLVEAFIHTELDYARLLDELYSHYVAGLSPEMTADEIDTLFCNLTDITKFQVDFCAVLKDKEAKNLPIAHMFLKILPKLESLYSTFALAQHAAREVLDRKAADHEFADGLQDLEKDSAKTLAGMLEMVKNRLWHYRDQFGAIAGCTGSEDSSYSATMEVMATFQRITTALKEKLDAQADATRNAMVAKQVDVLPEHDPGKGFNLRDGKHTLSHRIEVELWPMVKMRATFTRKSKRGVSSEASQKATLLVLNDCLLFVKVGEAYGKVNFTTCTRVLLRKAISCATLEGHIHVIYNKRELYDFKAVNAADHEKLLAELDVYVDED